MWRSSCARNNRPTTPSCWTWTTARGHDPQGQRMALRSAGLEAAFAALRPAGVLAVWSAGSDRAFTERLRLAVLRSARSGCRHAARSRGAGSTPSGLPPGFLRQPLVLPVPNQG